MGTEVRRAIGRSDAVVSTAWNWSEAIATIANKTPVAATSPPAAVLRKSRNSGVPNPAASATFFAAPASMAEKSASSDATAGEIPRFAAALTAKMQLRGLPGSADRCRAGAKRV